MERYQGKQVAIIGGTSGMGLAPRGMQREDRDRAL